MTCKIRSFEIVPRTKIRCSEIVLGTKIRFFPEIVLRRPAERRLSRSPFSAATKRSEGANQLRGVLQPPMGRPGTYAKRALHGKRHSTRQRSR